MTCLRHKLNDWIYIFLFYFRKWVFIICFNLILFHFFYFVSSFYHFSVAALEMGQTVCGSKLSTLRLLLSAAIQTIYFHFYLIVWIKKKQEKMNKRTIVVKVPSFELHSNPSCHNYFNFSFGPIAHLATTDSWWLLLALFYMFVCDCMRARALTHLSAP